MNQTYDHLQNKRDVEDKLKQYLHKTYGDCLVGEKVYLTPYCSDWVKDIVKTKNRLEKIVK